MKNPETGQREILIVGNYLPDGQESMLRFAGMLHDGLRATGASVRIMAPAARFGRLHPGTDGLGKWLAYVDKYLIFPWVLRRRVRGLGPSGVVHIADHSNAVYVPTAGSAGHPVVVTCHDLGAVRGALGEDTDCPATRMGKILQNWIARSLGKADVIPCDSTATMLDVQRLIRRPDGSLPPTTLMLIGLNVPYVRLAEAETRPRLHALTAKTGAELDVPYVLNVGSGLSRKNRDGVMRIFARTRDRWPKGRLVFAGEGLTPGERKLALELGVAEHVIECVKPTNAELEALYNRAVCLLFPSKFEGFGWPAVEAQACGCPVLCSDAGSLAEVVGESAFVRPFTDEEAFAEEILRLGHDENARESWREAGRQNIERFRTDVMIEKYGRLYDELHGAPEELETKGGSVCR